MAEKYLQLVQDIYEESEIVTSCAAGTTESFKVKVGLHQGSALSPFLFAVIMDRLTEEVRRESPWTMLFADDIVICEETREEVEWRLECWRFASERRDVATDDVPSCEIPSRRQTIKPPAWQKIIICFKILLFITVFVGFELASLILQRS